MNVVPGNHSRAGLSRRLAPVLAVVILFASCSSAPTTRPHSSRPPSSLALTTLVLATTTVKVGGRISGDVVVENDLGRPIHTTGCLGIFRVMLTSRTYTPSPIWPTCLQKVTMPTGRSTYPIQVEASYNACSQVANGTLPACSSGAPPPLPPGNYEAKTFESGNAVPLPAEVAVRVTR